MAVENDNICPRCIRRNLVGADPAGWLPNRGIDLAGEKKILDMSVAADLRKVYAALREAAGFAALNAFGETWSDKYPAIALMRGRTGRGGLLFTTILKSKIVRG